MEYLPPPMRAIITYIPMYRNAISLPLNGSFAWMKKAATPIPIIRGIVDRRVNKPSINRMEQTTSANTIMPSDKLEPTPNGSGNTVLRYSKFCNFGNHVLA